MRPDLDKEISKRTQGLFSTYALRFVTLAPSETVRSRESVGLWDGFDYLLKMLSDTSRLESTRRIRSICSSLVPYWRPPSRP